MKALLLISALFAAATANPQWSGQQDGREQWNKPGWQWGQQGPSQQWSGPNPNWQQWRSQDPQSAWNGQNWQSQWGSQNWQSQWGNPHWQSQWGNKNWQTQWNRQWSWRWECPNNRVGQTPECPATSCKDILKLNPWAPDGKYWMHVWGEEVVFPAWCDMTDGGWTLVWRVPSGVSFDRTHNIFSPADIWSSNTDWDEWRVNWPWSSRGEMFPKPYQSRFVRKWAEMKISKVKLSIVDDERPAKTLWFNAENANRWGSWFSQDRLTRVWPSWTDLDVASNTWRTNASLVKGKKFAIWGDIRGWKEFDRTWMINEKWGDCDQSEGWFVAVNDRSTWRQWQADKKPCTWEYRWEGKGIHWLYSKRSTKARWGDKDAIGVADSVLVWFW